MRKLQLIACLSLASLVTAKASASLLTYTESLTASGTLGTAAFNNAPLTFSVTADTNDIEAQSHDSYITLPFVNVTVGGLGSYTISGADGELIVVDYHFSAVGLTEAGFKDNYFGISTSNSDFGSYYLATPIGPIAGQSEYSVAGVATSGGVLTLSQVNDTSTFEASPSVVTPEPTPFLLLGTGLTALLIAGRHRRSGKEAD